MSSDATGVTEKEKRGYRSAAVVLASWAIVVIVAQLLIVAFLVPVLPARMAFYTWPKPSTEPLVASSVVVTGTWIGMVAIVVIALVCALLLWRATTSASAGLGMLGYVAVSVAVPVLVAFVVANGLIAAGTDGSNTGSLGVLPAVVAVVGLAIGIVAMISLPRVIRRSSFLSR